MLTNPEIKILLKQVSDFAAELKTVKVDFANYRAIAEERYTQDEIEKDDLRSHLTAAQRLNAMYEHTQPGVDKLHVQPQEKRVPPKARRDRSNGCEEHERASSPYQTGSVQHLPPPES